MRQLDGLGQVEPDEGVETGREPKKPGAPFSHPLQGGRPGCFAKYLPLTEDLASFFSSDFFIFDFLPTP